MTRLRGASVGQSDEELTTREGIEVVVDVSLDLLLVPDSTGLSLSVNSGDSLVEVSVCLHVLPERLSVVGVVAASVVLLRAVIGEGDSASSEGENLSLLQAVGVVTISVQEASVVVVIDEHTKGVNV